MEFEACLTHFTIDIICKKSYNYSDRTYVHKFKKWHFSKKYLDNNKFKGKYFWR